MRALGDGGARGTVERVTRQGAASRVRLTAGDETVEAFGATPPEPDVVDVDPPREHLTTGGE